MHFTKISAALLGLAAFTSAVPHQIEAGSVERRLTWTPRSLEQRSYDNNNNRKDDDRKDRNNNNNNVDITIVQVTEQGRNKEVELNIIVQEKLIINHDKRRAKDNIRKNHYRNKNKNVNTVVIVITVITDIRGGSERPEKRYMKHQVRANNNAREEVTIQVTEILAITVSNDNGRDNRGRKASRTVAAADGEVNVAIAPTAASAAIAAAIQTVDPNTPFAANNETMILSNGAPAPEWDNVEFDPAAILEDRVDGLYVQRS